MKSQKLIKQQLLKTRRKHMIATSAFLELTSFELLSRNHILRKINTLSLLYLFLEDQVSPI